MKPYTYLIKHKPTGQVYYGFRGANTVAPEEDLWQKYFTSSKRVQQLIEETSVDSFDVEIRRTFDTQEQAVAWETKVLRRMRVLESNKWLNQNIAGYIIPSEESCKKISDFHKDRPKTEEHKQKLSKSQKGKPKINSKNQTLEYKEKMSALKKGDKNAMYGKHHSKETRRKIGEANKANGHMLGDNNPMRKVEWTDERKQHMKNIRANRGPWTQEQKEKMAAKLRGQKREKKYCPHCDRMIAVGWYNRHGDNCKMK